MTATYSHDATITLTCAVDTAEPPADSWSWTKNFMTVVSQTTNTYTETVSYPGDNGAIYRCEAGNNVGVATSPDYTIAVTRE